MRVCNIVPRQELREAEPSIAAHFRVREALEGVLLRQRFRVVVRVLLLPLL